MAIGYPYGAASAPHWGTPNSHMNFCEEDYVVTTYIAEFINTITSLAYIFFGIHGIRRYKREGESLFSLANVPYVGLIGVGICSGVFHMTLKYHTQMADEMSMHFAMGCALIRVYTFERPKDVQSRNSAVIITGLTSFIIYHCWTDEFTLHIIIFVTLSFLVTYKIQQLVAERITNKDNRKKLANLGYMSSASALFAYFIWNIDVHLCPHVTHYKRQLGYPLGVLLELHGWWHILTAISSYTFMAMLEFLTSPEKDASHGIGYFWPAKAVLADIVPKKLANGAITNGYTSKKA